MAAGSASELEYHLLLARDLGFLTIARYEPLEAKLLDVRKMLTALVRKVDLDRSVAKC
jgi:four helix bundle protein